MRAVMINTVKLLGTTLCLPAGTVVEATQATILPVRPDGQRQYFVRPVAPRGEHTVVWPDKLTRPLQDSILVEESEIDAYTYYDVEETCNYRIEVPNGEDPEEYFVGFGSQERKNSFLSVEDRTVTPTT